MKDGLLFGTFQLETGAVVEGYSGQQNFVGTCISRIRNCLPLVFTSGQSVPKSGSSRRILKIPDRDPSLAQVSPRGIRNRLCGISAADSADARC